MKAARWLRAIGMMAVLAVPVMTPVPRASADSALLSESTYKRLSTIHELMGEEKYEEALQRLDSLAGRVGDRKYEHAVVMQTYGYLYVSTDQPRKAIQAFSESLQSQAMPESAEQNVRLNLAQLYLSVGEARKALDMYEAWIKLEKSPSAAGYALGGMLYAEVGNYTLAARYLNSAIDASDKPREAWYRLLLGVYYEDRKYARAASLLTTMIKHFPGKKEYWQQLAAVYSTLGNDRESLAVLQLAYLNGLLTEDKELLNLARFYIYMGIPYKGARLIQETIDKGGLEANRENLEILYQAYLGANELDMAIEVLYRISDASADGETLLKIARLQVEMGRWSEAGKTIAGAIGKGGLEDAGQAYLLQGITFHELGEHEKAAESFRRALREPASKDEARQWLAFLEASRTTDD